MYIHLLKAFFLTTGILSLLVAAGLSWMILFPESPKQKNRRRSIESRHPVSTRRTDS
jgi:hypothetical protein